MFSFYNPRRTKTPQERRRKEERETNKPENNNIPESALADATAVAKEDLVRERRRRETFGRKVQERLTQEEFVDVDR